MKNNLRLVGTLVAASLLSAGSAQAQTTGLRIVVGNTLGVVGLRPSAQQVGHSNDAAAPRASLFGLWRPMGTRGGTMNANSSGATDESLPGLQEADAQMRDDTPAKDAGADDSGNTTSSGGNDSMNGTQASRSTGNAQHASSDYRGSRERNSRDFHVGVNVGRSNEHSTEQQVRRNDRSEVRGSQADYQAPPSGQNAAAAGNTSGDGTAPPAQANASGMGSSSNGSSPNTSTTGGTGTGTSGTSGGTSNSGGTTNNNPPTPPPSNTSTPKTAS